MTFAGILLIAIGGLFVLGTGSLYRCKPGQLFIIATLYAWHTVLCIAYYTLFRNDTVDAISYFGDSFALQPFGIGTAFPYFVCGLLRFVFPSASIVDGFLLFNIVGALGLTVFYLSCLELSGRLTKARYLILFFAFLPGMSFWSSAIGKEPFAMLGVQLVFFGLLHLHKRYWMVAAGVLCVLLVRPHIAAVLLGSIGMGFLFGSRKYRVAGIAAMIVIGAGLWYSLPLIFDYLKVNSVDSAGVGEFIERNQRGLAYGGSSIDIASYNVFEKIFAYVYRPMVFEAQSVSQLLAAIENTLFLGITLWALFNCRKVPLSFWARLPNSAFLVFFLAGVLTSAYLTGNLGMAVRQKFQFMPSAFLLILNLRIHMLNGQAQREALKQSTRFNAREVLVTHAAPARAHLLTRDGL